MALVIVPKGVDKTFFSRQARQKLQIGFGDLHATLTRLVDGGKVLFVGRDGLLVDYALQDLRHAKLLEYPLEERNPARAKIGSTMARYRVR